MKAEIEGDTQWTVCLLCGGEMPVADGCADYGIRESDERWLMPVVHGDETWDVESADVFYDPDEPCLYCGVEPGERHHVDVLNENGSGPCPVMQCPHGCDASFRDCDDHFSG